MALVTVPLMTDTVLGEQPLEGGLRLMRFTGAIPVGAIAGGYAARWLGPRLPTLAGLIIGAGGLWLMSTWDVSIRDPQLSLHLVTGGFGFGLVIAPLVVSAVDAAGDDATGYYEHWLAACERLLVERGLAAPGELARRKATATASRPPPTRAVANPIAIDPARR